jgi:hypothetical protein
MPILIQTERQVNRPPEKEAERKLSNDALAAFATKQWKRKRLEVRAANPVGVPAWGSHRMTDNRRQHN